ncbi:MAG: hypothetical protein WCS52_00180 [bacterium]
MHRDMELSLDAITLPAWNPEDGAAWDEAFGKVENYLRACRVASRLHRARLTALILQRALARRESQADVPLATLAIDEARDLIDRWMAGLLPPREHERPYTMAEGFLSLYLCDAPMRWPNAFLNPQQEPPGFADTLHARLVKTGPELEVSSMVPRSMDRGLIQGWAGSAMDTFDRLPILRTLFVWTLFAVLLVVLFWYTRS